MLFRRIPIAIFFAAAIFPPACHPVANVTGVDVQYVEMNKNDVQFDSATDAIIHPYKDSLDKLMNVVIGTTDVEMTKDNGKTESLLGNFVCDLCLYKANHSAYPSTENNTADICLFNNGGFRSSLPKGTLTRKNIFELMPFDNELDVVTLSGKQMWNLLKFVAMSGGEPISGMRIGVNPDKTPDRVVIQGQVFDSIKTYKVLTSDYLANGGDKMDFFKNPIKISTTGIKIRDAILEYCESETAKGNILTSKLDGRFYYETK
ncbi:MAG TPA: 5'-nucleotidase [Bacteroidia bacterium]|nr:5'-nucleotidase [Bacteroidia bacterium]